MRTAVSKHLLRLDEHEAFMSVLTPMKRGFAHLSIAKKISCGYVLGVGMGVLGASLGLVFTDHLATTAQNKFHAADREIHCLLKLERSILAIYSYFPRLVNARDDSIYFEYEVSRFQVDVEQAQANILALKSIVKPIHPNLTPERPTLPIIEQQAQQIVDAYAQQVQALINAINRQKQRSSNTDAINLTLLTNPDLKQLHVQWERLSGQLILLIQDAEIRQATAEQEQQRANQLRQQLLGLSLLVTLLIASRLAVVTSRAIARPLQAVTDVALRVTREGRFSLEAPITTQDEVGLLARSLNQLIRWVREYTDEVEQARATLEQRVADRTVALQAANQQLQDLAWQDGLTHLANRRHFDHCLEREWRRAMRQQSPLALIMGDVDYFKAFNDTYGHPEGDLCLKQIATVIQACAKRSTDVAARYGGEEFVILLPDTGLHGAMALAEQVRGAVQALSIQHQGSLVSEQVTLSLGVCSLIPARDMDHNRLVTLTDQALYQAKEQGRNCVGGYPINS